jgi:hypothetical protein
MRAERLGVSPVYRVFLDGEDKTSKARGDLKKQLWSSKERYLPVPQSNSEAAGPPGCAFRYWLSCLLFLISSPVGETKTISDLPPLWGVNCNIEKKERILVHTINSI